MTNEELDTLFTGEISEFENWVLANQRRNGNPNPQGLINMERAILRSYMIYLHTKDKA